MRNKKILYIAVASLAVLGILSLLLRSTNLPELPRKTVETTARELHIGADQAIATDDQGSIYFSNGRYIVQYDTSSGQSKRLSRDGTLPTISQILVSPNSRYVAFQSISTTFDDDLDAQVKLTGYKSTDPQWWMIDSKTGDYILLPSGAKQATWDTKDNLHLLYSNNLLVFNSKAVREKNIKVKNIDAISVVGTTYLAQTSDGTVLTLDADGKELDKLGSKYESVYLSPRTEQYLSYELDGDEFKGVLHLTDERYRLAKFKELAFAWNNAGDRLAYADDDGFHLVDTKTKTIFDYKLTNGAVKNIREVLVLGDDGLVLRTEIDKVYVTGSSLETKPVENTATRLGDYEIQGFTDGNRFIVTKEGAYTPQDRANVYAELTRRGYNPDLLRVYFEEVTLSEHPL